MSVSSRRPYGALRVISALLIVSACIRFVAGATDAMANSPDSDAVAEEETQIPASPNEDISAAFLLREERLLEREAKLADRIQALNVAEIEISKQLAALQEAEDSLKATIEMVDSASETDLDRLRLVYENMAPKDAAALFEKMPPQFAAGFLGMMDPIAASKIMAGLTPETAYSFSVVIAGRNALTPKE